MRGNFVKDETSIRPMDDRDAHRLPGLGPRGEGYVVLQSLAIAAVAISGDLGPHWPDPVRTPLRIVGVALGAAGLTLVIGGRVALGRSFTPFPRPRHSSSTLVEAGPYRLVRHPLYGGVILLGLAWCLVSSPVALVAELLLVTVHEAKRRREEAWLLERYAGYAAYRGRVRRALIPWVY
jgi:protein-S-isoprenylcysteine O-methyltransferase Ste14